MYSVVIFCHIASLNGSILSLKKNSLVEISHIIIDFFIIPVPVILNQIQFCLETSLIVTTWGRVLLASSGYLPDLLLNIVPRMYIPLP